MASKKTYNAYYTIKDGEDDATELLACNVVSIIPRDDCVTIECADPKDTVIVPISDLRHIQLVEDIYDDEVLDGEDCGI